MMDFKGFALSFKLQIMSPLRKVIPWINY